MWKSRRTRVIGVGLVCIFGATLALLIVFMLSPPLPPLPNPNGYDDLRSAERIMIAPNDMSELGHDDLRALMSSNAPALQRVRLGLSRRCAVPIETAIANFAAVSTELMDHKALARLLRAEGRLAELEGRPADAVRSYVDAIRLGQAISHRGLIIHRLVGIACEGVGEIPLVKLVPRLTCEQIRPLVRELETIEKDAVTWDEIRASENRYVRAQVGNYPNPIVLLREVWGARPVRKRTEQRHDLAAARLRLLAVELALRCYRSERGVLPERLEQLTPDYLAQVPSDPFTLRPLQYHPQGTNWLLYSVGPDRVDDGGRPMTKADGADALTSALTGTKRELKGDLLYDSPW